MAVYEFVCPTCGKRFEVTAPMAEYDRLKEQPPACPSCGERQTRQAISSFVCKTSTGY